MLAAVQTVSAVLIGQMSGSLFAGFDGRKYRMSPAAEDQSSLWDQEKTRDEVANLLVRARWVCIREFEKCLVLPCSPRSDRIRSWL